MLVVVYALTATKVSWTRHADERRQVWYPLTPGLAHVLLIHMRSQLELF